MNLLEELKRRHVYRVAAAYVIVGWILIQVVTQVFPVFAFPNWVEQLVVILVLIGFPIALLLAWAFDATPAGVIRTDGAREADAPALPARRSRRAGLAVGLVGVLVAVIAGAAWWQFERGRAVAAPHAATVSTQRSAVPPSVAVSTGALVSVPHAVPASPVATQPIPAKSIAVLPFENLSTDKGNAYFADGMQDLILTKLADIGDLKVISRTSTRQYGSHPGNLKTIAQQLGVATILEGSVQKAGKQVLINVQLIDAKTDSHIWAQSYTRTLDNIFGVEGEVAQKVADALKVKLTSRETAAVTTKPTRNPAAFDDYLRGEHYLTQVNAGDWSALPKAIDAYQQAVDEDPQFALAWARLGNMRSLLMYANIDRSDATRQKALANARHAVALAPNLPQAHLALGYVYRLDFTDYDKALAQFDMARQGLPNNAEIEAAIAYIEGIHGNPERAAAGMRRAVALDPRNANLALGLGFYYVQMRQYGRALTAYRRALAVAPDDGEVYAMIAHLAVLSHGDVDGALAGLAQAPAALQSAPEIVYRRVRLLMFKRDIAAARRVAASLQVGGRFTAPAGVALLRGDVSRMAGDTGNARKFYTQALRLSKAQLVTRSGEGSPYALIALAEAGLGNKAKALQAVDELIANAKRTNSVSHMNDAELLLAQIHAQFGDDDQAIEALGKALAAPIGDMVSVPLLKVDPQWDSLRKDPRFQALLKKYADTAPAAATSTGGRDLVRLQRPD